MTRRRLHWREVNATPLCQNEVAWRLFTSARTKAKSRGLAFTLKYNDVLRQVRRGACPITGIPFDHRAKPVYGPDLPFRASLDRVDNTRGYHPDNIMVVAKIYNNAKGAWGSEDVLAMARGLMEQNDATREGGAQAAVQD